VTVHTKSLALHAKSAGEPTAEQLSAIRRYTLAEIPADKLYVRTFVVAHNAIDRDNECFGEDVLADFARTLPGKGLHIKHPTGWDGDSGPAKGRWFGAQLVRMSHDEARALLREPAMKWPPGATDAVLLMGDAYKVRTAGNADLLDELDGGIAGDVSVGFGAKGPERVMDDSGIELNVWRWKGPGEAFEASLVWLGAQPGARAVKSASRNTGADDMNLQEQLDAATTKAAGLQRDLDAAKPAADMVKGLRTALGDHAHLVDKPDELAATVKAAGVYRDQLIDEIVAAERKAGFCGDTDEDVTAAKAIYAGDPLDRLEARAKRLRGSVPVPRVAGSDPGEQSPAPADTKGAFTANPALAG
jgi:hypothetical protein